MSLFSARPIMTTPFGLLSEYWLVKTAPMRFRVSLGAMFAVARVERVAILIHAGRRHHTPMIDGVLAVVQRNLGLSRVWTSRKSTAANAVTDAKKMVHDVGQIWRERCSECITTGLLARGTEAARSSEKDEKLRHLIRVLMEGM